MLSLHVERNNCLAVGSLRILYICVHYMCMHPITHACTVYIYTYNVYKWSCFSCYCVYLLLISDLWDSILCGTGPCQLRSHSIYTGNTLPQGKALLFHLIKWLAVVYSDSYICERKHMFQHAAQSAGPESCICNYLSTSYRSIPWSI